MLPLLNPPLKGGREKNLNLMALGVKVARDTQQLPQHRWKIS